MKVLLWIAAWFTFNYLFALLNTWAWKNKVKKRMGYDHELEKKTCHAEFEGVARFLWPLSSGIIMPSFSVQGERDVTDNLPILDFESSGSYFATMVLGVSTIKAMALCFVFLVMLPMAFLCECVFKTSRLVFLWGVLVFLVSKLPGARKILQTEK